MITLLKKLHFKDTPPAVISISLVTAICLVGDSMLYIALPIFWREVGLDSLWQVGILLSINRFIRLPFNPIIGWVYQRISLKMGLIIAVILGTMTTFGYGMITGFVGWLILRGMWGIAWSFFRIGGLAAVIASTTDKNRGKTMGIYNGLYRLGSLFGMLIGGILTPFIGLKYVALLLGVCTLFAFFYLFHTVTTIQDSKGNIKNSPAPSLPNVHFPKGTFSIIISGFFVSLLFQGILTSTLSPLIDDLFNEPIRFAGIFFTVTALSGLIQAVRWIWEPFVAGWVGALSDGLKGRLPLFIYSFIFSAVVIGILPFSMSIYIWIFVSLLVMLSATSLTTLSDAVASDVAKQTNAVSFLTYYTISQDIGAALGPFFSYFLITIPFGFSYLYFGSAFILLILASYWIRVQKVQVRDNDN